MTKIYKVKADTNSGEPIMFALLATSYNDAERKAEEGIKKLTKRPTAGFFLLEEVKRSKKSQNNK